MRLEIDSIISFLNQCKANRDRWWGLGLLGFAIPVNDDSKKLEEMVRFLLRHHQTVKDHAWHHPGRNSTYTMHENIIKGTESIAKGEVPDEEIDRLNKRG